MSENALQQAVVDYLEARRLLFFHVPNGGKRGKREAARFVGLGVKRGVPDILIVSRCPDGKSGVAIELKTPAGRVSPEQIQWLEDLRRNNWHAVVCRSIDEVIALVRSVYGG